MLLFFALKICIISIPLLLNGFIVYNVVSRRNVRTFFNISSASIFFVCALTGPFSFYFLMTSFENFVYGNENEEERENSCGGYMHARIITDTVLRINEANHIFRYFLILHSDKVSTRGRSGLFLGHSYTFSKLGDVTMQLKKYKDE